MKQFLLLVIGLALLFSCTKNSTKPTTITSDDLGTLDVQFFINFLVDPYPTRQTVVWLTDENDDYVKTMFISAWLSGGGYAHQDVCSTWNAAKDWTDKAIQDFDGVTSATPPTNETNTVSLNLKESGLPPGMYTCNIETHIIDKYNILYSGTLEIKDKENAATPDPVFIPEKHEQANEMLNSVTMNYHFE